MNAGIILRDARRRAGLTQVELAARAGTSQAAISRRENGNEQPTLEMLQHLAFVAGAKVRLGLEPLPHSELRDALLAARERILDCLRRHGAGNPRIFGSVARGDDGPSSDIDLLVVLSHPHERSELTTLLALSRELTEIVGAPVDVSTEQILEPEIHLNALRDAVTL